LVLGSYIVFALVMWTQIGVLRIVQLTERIAQGDLTGRRRVREQARGTDADLMWDSIARMSGNLADIVLQVNASSEAIVRAAREVSEGTGNLSRRTEEQAATLEQTAGGMEELSATVKQNADSSSRASTLAEEVRTDANRTA
jgi:methyl-accepting chemotaxis protein